MGIAHRHRSFVPISSRSGVCSVMGQTHASSAQHRLRPTPELELAVDVRDVVADRFSADAALFGDERDRPGLADQRQDFTLGTREVAGASAVVRTVVVESLEHAVHQVRAHGPVAGEHSPDAGEELDDASVLCEDTGHRALKRGGHLPLISRLAQQDDRDPRSQTREALGYLDRWNRLSFHLAEDEMHPGSNREVETDVSRAADMNLGANGRRSEEAAERGEKQLLPVDDQDRRPHSDRPLRAGRGVQLVATTWNNYHLDSESRFSGSSL